MRHRLRQSHIPRLKSLPIPFLLVGASQLCSAWCKHGLIDEIAKIIVISIMKSHFVKFI